MKHTDGVTSADATVLTPINHSMEFIPLCMLVHPYVTPSAEEKRCTVQTSSAYVSLSLFVRTIHKATNPVRHSAGDSIGTPCQTAPLCNINTYLNLCVSECVRTELCYMKRPKVQMCKYKQTSTRCTNTHAHKTSISRQCLVILCK